MAVTRTGALIAGVVVLVVGLAIGILIGHFGIPKKADNTDSEKSPAELLMEKLTAEADMDISKKMIDEVDPMKIREYLRNLTEIPHLAGTPADKEQADQLAAFWKEQGFTHSTVVPYNVLLSYPTEENPNHLVLKDSSGEVVFESQKIEKVLSDDQNKEGVVPPFNAYSAPGEPEGELVYVNYGRIEDFQWLKESKNIDFTGKICIARYGKIFRGDKATNTEEFGAAGLIMYSDPADYAVHGATRVYPDSWWLPGTGVQRGSLRMLGDPLTPGYPSLESAYRIAEEDAGLPTIPVHPIGYDDARILLGNMTGDEVQESWRGDLETTYRYGPGMTDGKRVQLKISTHNERRTTYNAFAFIEGNVEPDRYVLLGNHRDAWVFGAVDPSSGTAAMMEVGRVMGKLLREGWKPRRTIILCSWGAEEQGLIGSKEWVENFGHILGDRAVGYINVDIAVQGNFTFRGRALPMIFNTLYDVAKRIPNPDAAEVAEGRKTMYDTWVSRYEGKDSEGQPTGKPKIAILGSGSDFDPFIGKVGVTCADLRYHYDESLGISSYPLYHSVYETFHLVDDIMDPDYRYHKAITQYWLELARTLADSYVIPYDVREYGKALENYYDSIENGYGENMRNNGLTLSLEDLQSALVEFTEAATLFHDKVQNVKKENPIEVRSLNDKILQLERAFIDPLGLPDRPYTRNIVFAPSAHNAYAGSSFPGIVDTLFGIDSLTGDEKTARWEEVKRQVSIVTFFIDTAADGLRDETHFSG